MKLGRNEPCPCGSGKKYKNCCLSTLEEAKAAMCNHLKYEKQLTAAKRKEIEAITKAAIFEKTDFCRMVKKLNTDNYYLR